MLKKLLADLLRMFGAYRWADQLDPPPQDIGGPDNPPPPPPP